MYRLRQGNRRHFRSGLLRGHHGERDDEVCNSSERCYQAPRFRRRMDVESDTTSTPLTLELVTGTRRHRHPRLWQDSSGTVGQFRALAGIVVLAETCLVIHLALEHGRTGKSDASVPREIKSQQGLGCRYYEGSTPTSSLRALDAAVSWARSSPAHDVSVVRHRCQVARPTLEHP